jgi:hypothetical protein
MRATYRFFNPSGISNTREGSLAMRRYYNLMEKYPGDKEKVQEEWSRLFPQVPEGKTPLSANEYGVYGFIPSTVAARDTLMQHEGLVREVAQYDPTMISVLTAGDDGANDPAIGSWLKENTFAPGADPYLKPKNPVEAEADRKRQDGWSIYIEEHARYQEHLARNGWTSNSKAAAGAKAQWDQFLVALGDDNPVWARDYVDGFTTKAPGVINTMRAAVADKAFMDAHQGNSTWDTVSIFLEEYERAKSEYARAGSPEERGSVENIFDNWVAGTLIPRDDGFKNLYETYLNDGRSLKNGGY